jgi:hypothetical protein
MYEAYGNSAQVHIRHMARAARRSTPTLCRMKRSVVFAVLHVVLCLGTLSTAAVMLWVAADLRKGFFRWKVAGLERLSPQARLTFARHRSIVLVIAAAWLLACAVSIAWLGLVISAWSAALSVAAAIVGLGYEFTAVKNGVKRA